MKYRKLQMALSKKGYDIRAKELGSFAYPTGPIWRDEVKSKHDYPIEIFSGPGLNHHIFFCNMRQVQRWFENGCKDADLPKLEFENGEVLPQKMMIVI